MSPSKVEIKNLHREPNPDAQKKRFNLLLAKYITAQTRKV